VRQLSELMWFEEQVVGEFEWYRALWQEEPFEKKVCTLIAAVSEQIRCTPSTCHQLSTRPCLHGMVRVLSGHPDGWLVQ
jgi:hypothetical protein